MHHHHSGTPSHHPYSTHGTPVPLADSPYDYPPSATMSPHPSSLPPADHHQQHHHEFSSGTPHPSSMHGGYGPPPDTGGNDFYNELNAHDDIFNLGANSHYMGDMGTPVNGAPGDFDDNGPHHSQFVDPSAFDPALGMTAPSHLSGLGDLEALDPSLQDPIDWRTQELEPVPDERAMNELVEGTTSSPTDTIAVAAPGGTGSESGGG
ncbi:hypothetical protein PG999_006756 [Apiospora kogelbergensis]|uniref:Uncharacterized protein n=1 Tax=Apiospora kogelbergensis TaxID=1337665 RepID=A0AAW0QWC6_9PEZI